MAVRTGDLAFYNRLFSNISRTQALYDRTSIQIATGEKALTYAEIFKDTNRLLTAENTFLKTSQFRQSIQAVRLRTNTMDSTMTDIINVASELRTLLISATNAQNYNEFDVEAQAKALMDQVASFLNKKVDGKYLFGGTKTDTKPVTLSNPLPLPSNNGGVDGEFIPFDRGALVQGVDPEWEEYYGYYQGNSEILKVRVDEDQVVDYGITANNDAFVQLIYGMNLAARFQGTGEELSRLNTALEFVNTAIDRLVEVQSGLGQKIRVMDNASKTHERTILYVEDTIVDIESTNIPEAVSKLSQYETMLQASYLVTSRISRLSIADYLR